MRVLVGCGALNCWDLTRAFLDSVESSENEATLMVVDQASEAPAYEGLAKYEHPRGLDVVRLHNGVNTGCSGAWNAVIRHAREGGYGAALICGNDVRLRPNTVDVLVREWGRCGLPLLSGHTGDWDKPHVEVGPIDFNCFLIDPGIFDVVGPFDEEFFPIYFEDNDYHWRLLEAGYEGGSYCGAPFAHGGSMTMKKGGIEQQVHATFEANRRRWMDKHQAKDVSQFELARSRRANIDVISSEARRRWLRYDKKCKEKSDIVEHLPTLLRLAHEVDHVTEMGVRWATSTTALLHAQPKVLECYDVYRDAQVDELLGMKGKTAMAFHQADVLAVEIQETDFLFVDTRHTRDQLRAELARHAGRVRKTMAFHDTTLFGARGEDGGPGLMEAVNEFLGAHPEWRIAERYENNNGLLVMRRAA